MENKSQKLKKLKKRNEDLKPIVFVSFKTDRELESYRKKIHKERVEYFENQEEIEKLEYELMTPKEKEQHGKLMRFLELKAKGEPFDPEEEGLI